MSYILDGNRIVLGVCYYPEQWPDSIWGSDLERMLEAGIEVIRIAEFAWNKFEPREGEFTFTFFDKFLDLCEKKGMKVIFCTPTATPPAWMSNKYPEILNADINGVKFRHGSRRHYNYNSRVYFEKASYITEKLASHYGKRKCIIGWQLDNELNCEVGEFYSDADTEGFRWWLLNKYHDIETLNNAWGTTFWNQTYTEWDEIYVPRRTCNGAQNPHQMLDYFRFISDATIRFAKEQADIIKKYRKPGDFITTNGLFGHLDNHELTKKCLDFITYDSYPNFTNRIDSKPEPEEQRDRWWSNNLTKTRSVSKIFGIMEQQTGANGWNIWPGVPNPRPGQITLWTMQSIAHGADYISFFRWRTATFGTEMYWHGILDYSGRDNERLEEVKKISNLVQNLETVAGKEYVAKVGIVCDYDNEYDSEIDTWHRTLEEESKKALFKTLQETHTPFDYVYLYNDEATQDLSKYDILFYPHPVIASKERADILEEYVKNGGNLVLCAKSGQKDLSGKCVMERLPGVFSNMSEADVFEYSFIQTDVSKIDIQCGKQTLSAKLYTERLSVPKNASIMGKYASEYFKGDVAFIKNDFGKGKVFYYGSVLTKEVIELLLEKTKTKSPFSEMVSVPKSVELAMRGDCLFILNYNNEPENIKFSVPVVDVISKNPISEKYTLNAYGFLVVKTI